MFYINGKEVSAGIAQLLHDIKVENGLSAKVINYFINGQKASRQDLLRLEIDLKNGRVKATAKAENGKILYTVYGG